MLRVGAALTAATTVATSRIVREQSNAGRTHCHLCQQWWPDADGGSFAYQEFQQ